MTVDAGLVALLRGDLQGLGAKEIGMFGGIAFLLDGHMVCGVHRDGAMFRVGKEGLGAGLAVPGTARMRKGARVMAGMIDCPPRVCADAVLRRRLMALAVSAVRALPPKVAKPAKG